MRINITVFWILSLYFFIVGTVYVIWNLLSGNTNAGGGGQIEWVGGIGLLLVSAFATLIAFYLQRSQRAQGGVLPEDRPDASIDDGDPELGFYSPWSWWPFFLAATAATGFLGLVLGVWVVCIAGGLFVVGITGWVYEYYRGLFAH